MSLISQATRFFNDKLFQDEFIRKLESKGHIRNKNTQLENKFILSLYEKAYITKKSFNELVDVPIKTIEVEDESVERGIINDFESIKHKDDTYEIIHEDYIDYDNIQIDGLEYYLHKISLSIVDSLDFGDMGVWDKSKECPKWESEVEEKKHLSKICPV